MWIRTIAAVLVAAFIQELRWLAVFGVNPNLVLIALAISAFIVDRLPVYVAASLVGAVALKGAPIIEIASLALLGVATIFRLLRRLLPWSTEISIGFSIIFGTVIFYALVDYNFLIAGTSLFIKEAVYNLIIGSLISLFIRYVIPQARRSAF